jgi:glucosamine-phosphate N-acetyltransferase
MSAFKIRLLEKEDYHLGFLNLLNSLTRTPKTSYGSFCEQYDLIKKICPTNYIYVLTLTSKENREILVGTFKLIIEPKFHNNFANMGHIEDVVVSSQYRGYGYGKEMIDFGVKEAFASKCYKVVLNCNKNNIPFYKKCGFKEKGYEMCIYSS